VSELILGIDTSVRVCVGLARDSEPVEALAVGDSRSHVELLSPALDALLVRHKVEWTDLDGIAVGMGPGPFTGLRVGVAAAQAMAEACGVPVYHRCSLDVLGVSWALTSPAGDFIACTDARRQELYWAVYDRYGRRLDGPHVSAPTALPRLPVVGPGTLKYPRAGKGMDSFLALKLGVRVDGLASAWPTPEEAWGVVGLDAGILAAYAHELVDAGPEPLYLRQADAAVPSAPKSVLTSPKTEASAE